LSHPLMSNISTWGF